MNRLYMLSLTLTRGSGNSFNITSPNNNQLSNLSYDLAGNVTVDEFGNHLTYDAEDRIAASGSATYLYDGDAYRVGKANGSGTTLYWPTAVAGILDESNSAGTAFGQQVILNGRKVWSSDTAGNGRFLFQDHLGTSQMEFSSGGWPIWRGQFAPFGGEIQNGANLPPDMPDGSSSHYKFTGKERDQESRLDYFGARYYGSNMGRWMSPDVVNVTEDRMMNPSSTLNKYAYGANNPLKYIDPDGEDITIFYRPDALGLPGHIMILAYNQDTGDSAIRSYGPVSQGLSALVSTPGTDSFGFANIKSPDDLRSQYGTITIKTTPEEAQKVIQEIRTHPDGNYGVFNSNCTTTCRNLLKKIGKTDPHGLQNSPSGFFFQLLKENGYNVPTGKIQGATYGQLRPRIRSVRAVLQRHSPK